VPVPRYSLQYLNAYLVYNAVVYALHSQRYVVHVCSCCTFPAVQQYTDLNAMLLDNAVVCGLQCDLHSSLVQRMVALLLLRYGI